MTTPALRVLTRAQHDQYLRDGFLTVPGVFAPAAMDRALEACDRLVYGMDFETWKARVLGGEALPLIGEGVGANFPTGVRELDSLAEDPTYLDIACDLLGTDDLHYLNGHLFVRSGPVDRRHADHPWEGYHIDRCSASFLPPHQEPFRFDYLGSGVFLHDVDDGCAPTVMLPGSHLDIPRILPRLKREGLFQPNGNISDIRDIPEFTRRTTMTGTKGSASFNCTNLVHGAVPFADRTQQRAWWTMALGRRSEQHVTRQTNIFGYQLRDKAVAFWSQTNARVRSLFGWPHPGDAYYSEATLELLAIWYPEMDLSEYRKAMGKGAGRVSAASAGVGG